MRPDIIKLFKERLDAENQQNQKAGEVDPAAFFREKVAKGEIKLNHEKSSIQELSEGAARGDKFTELEQLRNKNIEDRLSFLDNASDGEKDYLRDVMKNPDVTPEEREHAIKVMGGVDVGFHVPTGNGAVDLFDQNNHKVKLPYYMAENDKGVKIPVAIKYGEKPPKGYDVASTWGTQEQADDDNSITTLAKHAWNIIPDVLENVVDVIHLPQGLTTGEDADWYKSTKNLLQSGKFTTSTKSKESILNTENLHEYGDIFKADNWHFTSDNVVGTIGSLLNSVGQFVTGGTALKGVGVAGKIGTFTAGYMTNLGEALDAADNAGVKGRDKYAVASLVTIPVSLIEMQLGVEAKLLNPEGKAATKKLVQNLVQGFEKDTEGKITEKSLKELYDVATVSAAKIAKKYSTTVLKDAAGEASEEVLQNITAKAGEKIYDHLTDYHGTGGNGGYGTELLSPKAMGEYINDAIAGFVGGGGPAMLTARNKMKAEDQSKNAYDVTKKGDTEIKATKLELDQALAQGRITEQEHNNATFKIDSYKQYHEALKDESFDDETKRRIFDLTFHKANLEHSIEQLKAQPNPVKQDVKINPVNAHQTEKKVAEDNKEDVKTPPVTNTTSETKYKSSSKEEKTTEQKTEKIKQPSIGKSEPITLYESEKERQKNKDESKTKKIGDHIWKQVEYKVGENEWVYGKLKVEDDGIAVVETNSGRLYELGGFDGIKDETLESKGLSIVPDTKEAIEPFKRNDISVHENGKEITIKGKLYSNEYSDPLKSINRDSDGNVVSVDLTDKNGNKKVFRNSEIVDELAYNILLHHTSKKIKKENINEVEKLITIEENKNHEQSKSTKSERRTVRRIKKETRKSSRKTAIENSIKNTEAKQQAKVEKKSTTLSKEEASKIAKETNEEIKKASVPLMVTKDMEQQLADLSYPKEHINKMKPEEAHLIIEKQTKFVKPVVEEKVIEPKVLSKEEFNTKDAEDKFNHTHEGIERTKAKQVLGKLQPGKSSGSHTVQLKDGKFLNLASGAHTIKEHLPAIGEGVILKNETVTVNGKEVPAIGAYNLNTGKKFANVQATNHGTGTTKSGEKMYDKRPLYNEVKEIVFKKHGNIPSLEFGKAMQAKIASGEWTKEQAEEALNDWAEMKRYNGEPNMSDKQEVIIKEAIAKIPTPKQTTFKAKATPVEEKIKRSATEEALAKIQKMKQDVKNEPKKLLMDPTGLLALTSISRDIVLDIAERVLKGIITIEQGVKEMRKRLAEKKVKAADMARAERIMAAARKAKNPEEMAQLLMDAFDMIDKNNLSEIEMQAVENAVDGYMSSMFGDGEAKLEAFKGKLRYLYSGIEEFGKDEFTEAEIINIAKELSYVDGKPFEANFEKSIQKYLEKAYKDNNEANIALGARLQMLHEAGKDSDLVSLFVHFRSYEAMPYHYAVVNPNGSIEIKTMNVTGEANMKEVASKKVAGVTEEQFQKIKADVYAKTLELNKKIFANRSNPEKLAESKELAKQALNVQADAMEELTGIPSSTWLKYAEGLIEKSKVDKDLYTLTKSKDQYDFYVNKIYKISSPSDLMPGEVKQPPFIKNLFQYWSGTGFKKIDNVADFKKYLLLGNDNKGGLVNGLSQIVKNNQSKSVTASFLTPGKKRKSSYSLISHFTNRAKQIMDAAKHEGYKNNSYVQWQAKQGNTADVAYIAGINNQRTGKDLDASDLGSVDIAKICAKFYANGTDSYYQLAGQFGDKDSLVFIKVPKYNDAKEAKLKLAHMLIDQVKNDKAWKEKFKKETKEYPNEEEIKSEAKQRFEDILRDTDSMSAAEKDALGEPIGKNTDAIELLSINQAINFIETNHFINGAFSDYKGIEDIVKRNGSTLSPGMEGSQHVEGGMSKGFDHVITNAPFANITLPAGVQLSKALQALNDGQSYILKSLSDKINKSYGSIFDFHTSVKAITSFVDGDKRFLDKTNSVVIDYLAKDQLDRYTGNKDGNIDTFELTSENINDLPYLALYQVMSKGGVEKLSNTEGTKKLADKKALKLFKEYSHEIDFHVFNRIIKGGKNQLVDHTQFIPTENYLVQQDLRSEDGGRLKEGTAPIQGVKNIMSFAKIAIDIAKDYNQLAERRTTQLRKDLTELSGEEIKKGIKFEKKLRDKLREFLKITDPDTQTDKQVTEDNFFVLEGKDYIASLIDNGIDLEHPHIKKWLHTYIANQITNKALLRSTNKAMAVSIGDLNVGLRDMEIKGDKVRLSTVAVPKASGFRMPKTLEFKNAKTKEEALKQAIKFITKKKSSYLDMFLYNTETKKFDTVLEHEIEIEKTENGYSAVIPGEIVKYTRIPADDMHSHTIGRVGVVLPKELGNHIITPTGVQVIAGEDFDGDKRTIQGLFKDKTKTADGKRTFSSKLDSSDKGLANQALLKELNIYYDAKNAKALVTPIDTEANDKYVNHFKKILSKQTSKENVGRLSTLLNSRVKNNVGLKVVGAIANLLGTYDYLRAHNSGLKNDLSFPKLNMKSGFVENVKYNAFSQDQSTKPAIGNLINLALDNVKDPKIEILGLNENTVNGFIGLLMLGADMESVSTFYNHPIIRKYTQKVRENASASLEDKEKRDLLIELVKETNPSLYNILEADAKSKNSVDINNAIYNDLFKEPINNLKKDEFAKEDSIQVLQKLIEIENIGFDFFAIQSVIRATEAAPKSFADYYTSDKNFQNVVDNALKNIDTTEFKNSPFTETARFNLYNISKQVFQQFDLAYTDTAQNVLGNIENSLGNDKTGPKKLSKRQVSIFNKAINDISLVMSRNFNGNTQTLFSNTIASYKKMLADGGYKEFTDLLELKENAKFGSKLSLREGLKRNEIPADMLKAAQVSFDAMLQDDPELANQFIDYLVFQYNFAKSKLGGSFVELLPLFAHEFVGLQLAESNKKHWKEANSELVRKITEEIVARNPELMKDKKMRESAESSTFEDKVYNPIFVNKPVFAYSKQEAFDKFATENSYTQLYSGDSLNTKSPEFQKAWNDRVAIVKGLQVGDTIESTFNGKTVIRTVKSIKEVKKDSNNQFPGRTIEFEPISQKQKISSTGNKKIDKIIAHLKANFKSSVSVVYDENLDAAGELSADGKTIRINPNYAGEDTAIHEFAHILIDAMGNNKIIIAAINQLKGTDLWKETEKKYPELTPEQLAKEVLAEAIGREGANIFELEKDKSKFRQYLEYIFDWMKRKLGIEKNAVKSLAKQVLSGINTKEASSGVVQKQKNAATIAKDALKKLKKLIVVNEEEHTYTIGDQVMESSVTTEINKLPDYKYNGPKNEEKINNKAGTACHKVFEGIVNKKSKTEIREDLKKAGLFDLFATEEAFDQVMRIMDNLYDRVSLEGEVFSEIPVASFEDLIGGAIDIPVVRKDGSVDIYDIKTSEKSTEHGQDAIDYRYTPYKDKKTTMEKHKIQLGTYGAMLENGIPEQGIPGVKVNNITIVPIRIDIKGNKITGAIAENHIPFQFEDAKKDVHRVLRSIGNEKQIEEDREELMGIQPIDKDTFMAQTENVQPNQLRANLAALQNKLKETKEEKEKELIKMQIEDINNKFDRAKDAYEKYLTDIRQANELAKENGFEKVAEEGIDALMELYNRLNAMNKLAKNAFINDVMIKIARYLHNNRKAELEKVLADKFDKHKANNKDISALDVWFKSLTHMTEAVPELQAFAKIFNDKFQEMLNERETLKSKGMKLAEAVIRLHNKQMGIVTKAGQLFVNDNAKYFDWMMNENGEIIGSVALKEMTKDAKLYEARLNYLKWYESVKDKFKLEQEDYASTELVKVDMSFGETLRASGLVEAISHVLGDNFALNNAHVNYNGKRIAYSEAREKIFAKAKSGSLADKGLAILELLKYYFEAKKQVNQGYTIDGDGEKLDLNRMGEYSLNETGKLVNKFGKPRGKNRGFSKDFHKAMLQYIDEMTHTKHMSDVMPLIDAIEHFNSVTDMDHSEKPNVVKWVQNFRDMHLLKVEKDILGPELGTVLKLLRKMTSQIVMAFNVPAAKMNLIMGVYNNWRALGKEAGIFGKGYARLVKGGKIKGGDWDAKAHAILTNYKIVSIDFSENPRTNIYGIFGVMAHGMTKIGEYIIQGGGVLSLVSDEDYAKWNDRGEVIDSKGLSASEGGDAIEIAAREKELSDKILIYKDRVSDLQGKYSEKDRRNIMNSELGKFFMQFRVWIPDWWKERFGEAYVTYDNRETMGSYRKIFHNGIKQLMADAQTKDFWKNPDMQKNLRGAIFVAALISLSLAGGDDDDDKKGDTIDKTLGDLLFIFDPKTLENTVKSPAPGFNTLTKVVHAMVDGLTAAEYKSDKSKFGNKGDLKVVGDVAQLIPYNKLYLNEFTLPE